MTNATTYEVVRNDLYGDYRVAQYINGEWDNEFDDNWTKAEAEATRDYLTATFGLTFFIN